ncbi:hypothetical protein MIN45_PP21 (plasmid) [Methylomarinovum tepidoasis]|uniref:Bacterial mobilisation domain-containing protein n=1 Tax=Methylomarinovum tepidoasis TaxID=2840183 RepID=A0AAU9CQT6_9GAMM|nr:hypothetical protein MIN45_PP21 [Methylomarinovum sp. IN45]
MRFTESDLRCLVEAAESAGLSVSDFVRMRVLAPELGDVEQIEARLTKRRRPQQAPPRRRRHPKADPELIRQLAKIGNNFNQIARWANTYKRSAEAVEIIAGLLAIEAAMRALLAKVSGGDRDAH